MAEFYGVTGWIKACLAGFQLEGWDQVAILEQAGVAPSMLSERYCSFDIYNRIFVAATTLYGDTAGIVARRGIVPVTFDSFSLAVMCADSMYHGLCFLIKHNLSLTNALMFEVSKPNQAIFSVAPASGLKLEPAIAVAVLGTVLKTSRFIQPGSKGLKRVEMALAAPSDSTHYDNYFKAPIDWNCGRYALHFSAETMHTPSMHANQELLLKSERNWLEEATVFKNNSFILRVRSYIKANLANEQLSIELVAREFSMSVRTLQRRLDAEATSFKQLVELTRKTEALKLIANPKTSISKVAYALGFSDVGNLSRAFRRWFDKTPEQFRKK